MFFKKLAFFSFFILSGCGFSPLYKENIIKSTNNIYIAPIANYEGFLLHNQLSKTLSPKKVEKYDYILTVYLDSPQFTDQNIQNDNFASREKISIKAIYNLKDKKTDKILLSSSTFAQGAFNIIDDPYAVQMTEKKQTENIIDIISTNISLQILAYLKKSEVENESKTKSN